MVAVLVYCKLFFKSNPSCTIGEGWAGGEGEGVRVSTGRVKLFLRHTTSLSYKATWLAEAVAVGGSKFSDSASVRALLGLPL